MEKLRFAPIIRVSTENQKQKGESINVQTEQITHYVEQLGGTIPDHCWRYKGQEDAPVDEERRLLDRMLEDSGKKIFDAVGFVPPGSLVHAWFADGNGRISRYS